MRVAHFIHRFPPALGGSEAYFARLSRYLAQQGDQVVVFTTTALDLTSFRDRSARQVQPGRTIEDQVEVRRFRLAHVPLAHRLVLKVLSLLPVSSWQALTAPCNPMAPGMWQAAGQDDGPFDLVHATAFPYSFPLSCARRLARRLGVPFLLTPFVHTGDPNDPHDPVRRAYTAPALVELARSADRLFVQTEGEREVLLHQGIPPQRLVLQGLGVDASECTGGSRRATRQDWQVDELEVVIGHLANRSVEKGTVDLLRAAQECWARGARMTLVLAGPEMPNFRTFWQRFRPGGRVLRLGPLDEGQKRDFFAAIDVFALPSRTDSFGLVLPEAWANGVPCVGYRAGGIPWVIREGSDGLLVACGDLRGLADALERLVCDVGLRRRMGEAGRLRVPVDFAWQDKLARVRAVYQEVISENARRPVPPGDGGLTRRSP